MNISDEAVEAAARAVRKKGLYSNYYPTFDALRTILEAAAPHLMAEAWERGYLMSHYLDRGYEEDNASTYPAPEYLLEQLSEWNPYRAGAGE